VDTNGLLIAALVHAANVQDRDGAKHLLAGLPAMPSCQRLKLIWADGAYAGELIVWVQNNCGWRLEVVSRPPEQKGFVVVPRRWVVERTFSWLCRNRRLSKDYKEKVQNSETDDLSGHDPPHAATTPAPMTVSILHTGSQAIPKIARRSTGKHHQEQAQN